MYILVGYLGFNLRRPGVHPQESAATFDEIPCWTPLADALLATLHMDDDVSSGPKTRWKKTHQEGGGMFSSIFKMCVFSGEESHRFRFWDSGWRPKMDPFILLVHRCTCTCACFNWRLTLICQERLWIDFVCGSGDRMRYWLHHHQFMNSINHYLLYMTWTLDVFKKTFLP